MLHFVIKDVNPTILQQSSELIKVLNETVLLISAATGPILNNAILKKENDQITFQKSENDYQANFQGTVESDQLKTGKFLLREDGALILELAFTVNHDDASDIRIKLNCEGESLVRQELERSFERSYSFEAETYMKLDLEAHKKSNQNTRLEETEAGNNNQQEENVDVNDESSTIELSHLSPLILQDLTHPKKMLDRFNNITHDIFRGVVGDFSMNEIGEEIIENGAKIKFLDYEHEDFTVTFRHGVLDGETEVSFFLEEGATLICSIHCSSQGHATITTEDDFLGPRIVRLLH